MRTIGLGISLLIMSILLLEQPLGAQQLTAKEIITKADKKNRGETMKGEMTMTIVRPKWERKVSMKMWSKGDKYFMIYITAPAKEKGQVFLKVDKEMWNYVPSISRMIKIPPSMMMQSWMGSDFTNDDLVKQSSIVVDYDHKLLGEETIRDQVCYKIELIPHEDAAVVWGKIISWVTKNGYNLWKSEYYDEDGYLQNREDSYDIKKFGDRELPSRIEMIPADKEGQKTVLEILSSEFNVPIDDSFFSKQNMKKVR
ncbi:MAG: outer membrane lipoprotein-sorting protein [Bacteroidetes bacterium]|nr:MAG: outer membrane lipoprotein-sorting protein [Bacteroidota bacterium]RLD48721.1 MAG: outer membrane lipoprotein-sorting protein [Bacteroidota bacterium]RLD74043.1 MAG: outer membrane lipoprotein-sorting protein [Bacteroidota bacterium]RLD88941.1 MAG: outer membrane lipoprotein-sorting protein [Bacteroidota bacterium]